MANDIAIMVVILVVVMNLQVVLVVDKACFSADESCQDPLKSAKSITINYNKTFAVVSIITQVRFENYS